MKPETREHSLTDDCWCDPIVEEVHDLSYARADARHWYEGWKAESARARQFARQAREGELLRAGLRQLASSGEDVTSDDLRRILGEPTGALRAGEHRG